MYFLGKVPVKNGYPPTPWRLSKISIPELGVSVKNGYPLQGAGSFSGQQGRIVRKEHSGRPGNCAKGAFCHVLFSAFHVWKQEPSGCPTESSSKLINQSINQSNTQMTLSIYVSMYVCREERGELGHYFFIFIVSL